MNQFVLKNLLRYFDKEILSIAFEMEYIEYQNYSLLSKVTIVCSGWCRLQMTSERIIWKTGCMYVCVDTKLLL